MRYYVSDGDGTGGRLRTEPEDFRVREREAFAAEPVDADPGDYPHLLLRVTLRNWDTNDFASAISDRLGISRERISWAGTKDKRAVTTQLFSIDGVDRDDLPDLSDATVEVVGRTGRPILFGDLAGNSFEVRIRDADDPEAAERVLRELRAFGQGEDVDAVDPDPTGTTVGVPNFFGQQRFGSTRPVTHEVGLAIVREDWEAAAMAYVGNPHERERDRTREARKFVAETRDWTGALDRFPDYLGYERAILHRLAEGAAEEADFREALETLPTNLQSLFVNAAQSSVFNRICSERLERGLSFAEPVVGDVVCFVNRSAPGDLVVPDPDRTQRVTADRLDTVRRHCERGRAFVTAPLVGTESDLGEGEPGEIERDVLDDVGVAPADFDLPGAFDSAGTRRAILLRTEVAIEEPLALSFSLPKGSYATVVLREFLKCDPADL